MSLSRSLAGILAPIGRVRQYDLDAFSQAQLNLVRLRAEANAPEDILLWRDYGAENFIVHLLSPLTSYVRQTPEMFTDYFSEEIHAFMEQDALYFEIHDKPNRVDRGAGVSWADGDEFASWFFETHHILRSRFGDTLRIGFPALFPTDLLRSDARTSQDEVSFSEQCIDAMAVADWVAVHAYWRSIDEMRGYHGTMRFLRLYMEQLPTQAFIITEFANVNPHISSKERGLQYKEFFTATAQYDQVAGACSLIMRSSDRLYDSLAWLDQDGRPRPLLAQVAERPCLPDPKSVKMHWPTKQRQYNQYFGARQQKYYECYQITGGHNGVDLRIDRHAPHKSPIYAALTGTVIQVALEESGYGHYVCARSYGPEGEDITLIYAHLSVIDVAVGMLVQKGDVLGWGGSTGDCDSAHLHFGMRIKGVENGAVCDWLNPRPYLDVMEKTSG